MKLKTTLLGAGLLLVGYQTGKIVGYVRCSKFALNVAESIIPGFKKTMVKTASDTVIEKIFKTDDKEESK